jgi:hypothetical protein
MDAAGGSGITILRTQFKRMKTIETGIYLSAELDTKSTYVVRKTMGGSTLLKLENDDESGLVKVKIDEQVFKILQQKKGGTRR